MMLCIHYDVTVESLRRHNPGLGVESTLTGGQLLMTTLKVPLSGRSTTAPFRSCTKHPWCLRLAAGGDAGAGPVDDDAAGGELLAQASKLIAAGSGSTTYTRVKTVLVREFGAERFAEHKDSVIQLLQGAAERRDALEALDSTQACAAEPGEPPAQAAGENPATPAWLGSSRATFVSFLPDTAQKSGEDEDGPGSESGGPGDGEDDGGDPFGCSGCHEKGVANGTPDASTTTFGPGSPGQIDPAQAKKELALWETELRRLPNTTEADKLLRSHMAAKISRLEDKIVASGGALGATSSSFLARFDAGFQAVKDSTQESISSAEQACICCGVVFSPWAKRPPNCTFANRLGTTVDLARSRPAVVSAAVRHDVHALKNRVDDAQGSRIAACAAVNRISDMERMTDDVFEL